MAHRRRLQKSQSLYIMDSAGIDGKDSDGKSVKGGGGGRRDLMSEYVLAR